MLLTRPAVSGEMSDADRASSASLRRPLAEQFLEKPDGWLERQVRGKGEARAPPDAPS